MISGLGQVAKGVNPGPTPLSANSVRVALVTGACQGIGKGIALQLAKDGFNIAIADLPFQEKKAPEVIQEIADLGREAAFFPVDVVKKADLVKAIDGAHEKWGRFDAIVNNAGICQVKPLLEVTDEDTLKILNINVVGCLNGIQAAAAKFISLGVHGKIVNACSIAGHQAFPMLGIYSATKFAVRGLTQSAAQELATHKINVNAYCPGIVLTPMWDFIDSEMARVMNKPIGASKAEFVSKISLGRGETPEDVAGLASFLCSEKADYITGQSIIVDGGLYYN